MSLRDAASITQIRHGALDGGDWRTLALAILADEDSSELPPVVIADCYRISQSALEPTDVEQRKLLTLSNWIDKRGADV